MRDEVEDVELPTRMAEEPRQIVQAFQITQGHGVVLEGKGPVVTGPPKHVGVLLVTDARRDQRPRWCGQREADLDLSPRGAGVRGQARFAPTPPHGELRPDSTAGPHVSNACPGARQVACRQPYSSVGHGRAGRQGSALERRGHLGKFVGRFAGTDEVAGSDVDLHARGEQWSTAQVCVRRELFGGDGEGMVEGGSDGRRRQSDVALSQAHSGESRLWIPPGFAGGEEGLFRTLEVAQLESDAGPTR